MYKLQTDTVDTGGRFQNSFGSIFKKKNKIPYVPNRMF